MTNMYQLSINEEICCTVLRKVNGLYGTQFIIKIHGIEYFLPCHKNLNLLLTDKVGNKVIIKKTSNGGRYSAFNYKVIVVPVTTLDDF